MFMERVKESKKKCENLSLKCDLTVSFLRGKKRLSFFDDPPNIMLF